MSKTLKGKIKIVSDKESVIDWIIHDSVEIRILANGKRNREAENKLLSLIQSENKRFAMSCTELDHAGIIEIDIPPKIKNKDNYMGGFGDGYRRAREEMIKNVK